MAMPRHANVAMIPFLTEMKQIHDETLSELLAKLDVDVTDPNFWELGLHLLGEMVADAEKLAE